MKRNVLDGKTIIQKEFPDVGGLTLAEVEAKCKGFFTKAQADLDSAERSMVIVVEYCEEQGAYGRRMAAFYAERGRVA
jgi:hypothetical protein